MKNTTKVRPCDGSGVRVTMTAGEAYRSKPVARCPHCSRELRVRVGKGTGPYRLEVPEATIPKHNPEA